VRRTGSLIKKIRDGHESLEVVTALVDESGKQIAGDFRTGKPTPRPAPSSPANPGSTAMPASSTTPWCLRRN